MSSLIKWFMTSIKRERGATAIEYALIVAFIALVIITTVMAIGGQLNTIFTAIKDAFAGFSSP